MIRRLVGVRTSSCDLSHLKSIEFGQTEQMPAQPQAVRSFAPVIAPNPAILILGSMPGVASLDAHEYYAHPRNAFWPILIASFAEMSVKDVDLAQWQYEQRLRFLAEHRIALWDVLAECVRPGSLDSAIDNKTVSVNPITSLLQQHTSIEKVLFNGKTAFTTFKRHIIKTAPDDWNTTKVTLHTLPSTSPAMAQMTIDEKFVQWQEVLLR